MSTFVKVRASNRNMAYLNLRLADEDVSVKATKSGFGLEIPVIWSQLDEDEPIVKKGESISIYVGDIKPKTFHVELHANPLLHASGIVSHVTLCEPDDEVPIFVNFISTQDLDFRKLDWLCRIYLRD